MYRTEFYREYEDYLREADVREAHNFVFDIVARKPVFQNVIDLGCGASSEYYHYAKPAFCLGVDVNFDAQAAIGKCNLSADYRKCDYKELHRIWRFSAFVSLFSVEITAPYMDNYRLYETIFRETPVEMGLVSGFFYANRKYADTVQEAGGVVSHQTLEPIDDVESDLFSETRIILPVPSRMFGDDVFEVWKIFEKRREITLNRA